MMHRLPVTVVAICALLGAACVNDGKPPPRSTVRDIPAVPSGVLPTEVDLSASRYAVDSDKNGYADLINVTVYLFNPGRYTASLATPGSFQFRLERPDGSPLATWDFTPEESAASRQMLLPGPGYMFKLTLLDKGGDQVDVPEGQLWCTFTPVAHGGNEASSSLRPISSRSPIRVAIGRGR